MHNFQIVARGLIQNSKLLKQLLFFNFKVDIFVVFLFFNDDKDLS